MSNPTKVRLPQIIAPTELIVSAVNAGYDASPQGLAETRDAISQLYRGLAKPEQIQLFASTSEAIGCIIKLFCRPGDEIVTCTPTYPLLDCLSSLECVRMLTIPLQDCAGKWEIDFWTLERTCTEKTRIFIAVSPNNPTGHCIPQDEMARLSQFCARRRIGLVVDEVFASYRFGLSNDFIPELTPEHDCEGLVIRLSGLSKVCGQPQHKLGWAIFGGDRELAEESMQRMLFITDSMLSVSGWVQRIAPFYIQNRNIFRDACLDRITHNYRHLTAYAQNNPVQWTVDDVDGGWSACIRLPGWADDEEIATWCANEGVRVFPGTFFGYRETQPTLVVSLITPADIFKEGIDKLASLLQIFLNQ